MRSCVAHAANPALQPSNRGLRYALSYARTVTAICRKPDFRLSTAFPCWSTSTTPFCPGMRCNDSGEAPTRNAGWRSPGPTAANADRFIAEAKRLNPRPTILVIGGGTVGNDADALYRDPDLTLIGTDIYRSDLTQIIADGHQLPLASGAIHGVWIQAVLEHVLTPEKVVAEIHRVLVPDGVVYAETPFMQQVHEGAYDFTRFTLSGHRWLFRHFEEIDGGITRGPAIVMLWAVRYFVSSLFGSYKIGTMAAIALFWLRYFERLLRPAYEVDGASAVYFLGRRSERAMKPKDMVSYYKGAQR
jgi:SAM-dependent methyltransferase